MMMSTFTEPRFWRPALSLFLAYVLHLVASWAVREAGWTTGDLMDRWLAVCLPILPLLLATAVFVGVWKRLDEVEKALHLTGLGVGFTLALLSTLLVGRLAELHILEAEAPWILLATVSGWMIGLVVGWLRLR